MKIEVKENSLKVTGLQELDEPHGAELREQVLSSIKSLRDRVEVDLSETRSVNGGGMGALVSLQKVCANIFLVNPLPPVRQVLELARMDRIFDIIET